MMIIIGPYCLVCGGKRVERRQVWGVVGWAGRDRLHGWMERDVCLDCEESDTLVDQYLSVEASPDWRQVTPFIFAAGQMMRRDDGGKIVYQGEPMSGSLWYGADDYYKLEAENAKLREALKRLLTMGIEMDDKRIDYVVAQVDRDDIDFAKGLLLAPRAR